MSAAAMCMAPAPAAQTAAWYALHTQSSREKTARDQLRFRGIEVFWPYFLRRSTWGRRGDVVRIETALFPGYLFARFDPAEQLLTVKLARGISQIVGLGARPVAIGEDVIETLRRACANPALVSPADYLFTPGERVTVANGPFAGLSGVVDRAKGRARIIITIDILRRACAVEVGAAELLKASPGR